MLYHLFDYLSKFNFPGARLFQYLSFRSSVAIVLSLLIAWIFGKYIIRLLQRKQIGEEVRDLGLEGQIQKKGTPTMGGIIILLAILVPMLLVGNLTNVYVWLMIITTVWLGFIGFLDDYIKVFKKNKNGLHGKFKIIGQVCLGLIVAVVMLFNNNVVVRERATQTTPNAHEETINSRDQASEKVYVCDMKNPTQTTIPFVKQNEFDYAWLSPWSDKFGEVVSWLVYAFLIVLIITAVSNGANLTDGMDGLVSGISIVIGTTLGILAYLSGNVIYAEYLNIMYIPNTGELVVFMAAFIGALVGFLWYNSYPAQVFMGDTGSLAIGGIIAVFAIIIRKELLIPILCGIFFVESLSVILQTLYFKYTKRKYGEGRRVFKMSPLHHHFQKSGNGSIDALIQRPVYPLPEAKIVTRFWIVTVLLAVITVATLKVR